MPSWPSFVRDWGSTPAERSEPFPCDRLITEPDLVLYRAVDVAARPETVFRWLCQLRVAPYSYDLLDNGGRRSPQTLTPGLERLAPGQRVMRIFALIEYEVGSSITVLSEGRLFGRVACTYRVGESASGRSRLLAKLLVARPQGSLAARPMGILLPPGDLVMMRRQLLNLKRLAETQDTSGPGR
jgi:hypothetical protein